MVFFEDCLSEVIREYRNLAVFSPETFFQFPVVRSLQLHIIILILCMFFLD